jgi:hypothetical protein
LKKGVERNGTYLRYNLLKIIKKGRNGDKLIATKTDEQSPRDLP